MYVLHRSVYCSDFAWHLLGFKSQFRNDVHYLHRRFLVQFLSRFPPLSFVLQPTALLARFGHDIARVSVKRDKKNVKSILEHL